jgi:hypothetical protein
MDNSSIPSSTTTYPASETSKPGAKLVAVNGMQIPFVA